MIRHFILAAGAIVGLGAALMPAPVLAQANDKVLMIFGQDKCPAGTTCVRAPETERFRIPKDLRQSTEKPQNQWADRAKSLDSVGASGTGSCSATGAGGWTGCFGQQMRTYKQDRAADAKAASNQPQ
ncbi:hypothetical protein FHS31_001087 [Sphingomonas vulcanisoli]|uniref:Secreted protein n=1 Tax=Sphingomonas vulcanisoli TaxID=1658060 RepID=A0ABX0TPZ7_9SPHN|nr:hypothetical protein [Sphingomonas vulcanisoli]NIJ07491.1 hypothetical protein [Sphingomonas vulcanisoli]